MKHVLICLFASAVIAASAVADPARIVAVEARPDTDGWRFSVTLSHGDTGWDDYADGWRVLTPEGEVLGTRVLAHPHVNEQPFTRSLGGVAIPEDMKEVMVQASTLTEGWAPGGTVVSLQR